MQISNSKSIHPKLPFQDQTEHCCCSQWCWYVFPLQYLFHPYHCDLQCCFGWCFCEGWHSTAWWSELEVTLKLASYFHYIDQLISFFDFFSIKWHRKWSITKENCWHYWNYKICFQFLFIFLFSINSLIDIGATVKSWVNWFLLLSSLSKVVLVWLQLASSVKCRKWGFARVSFQIHNLLLYPLLT